MRLYRQQMDQIGEMISLSLSKALIIDGQYYYIMNISHQEANQFYRLYNFQIGVQFEQFSYDNQSNYVFDFMKFDNSQYHSAISCYQQNVNHLNHLYSLYQPCEESCIMPKQAQVDRKLTSYEEIITNQNSGPNGLTIVIDNTFFPCNNGSFLPQLNLSFSINTVIQANRSYFLTLKIICLCLLQILVFAVAYIIILISKLTNRKKKISALRQQIQAQKVLDSFIEKH